MAACAHQIQSKEKKKAKRLVALEMTILPQGWAGCVLT